MEKQGVTVEQEWLILEQEQTKAEMERFTVLQSTAGRWLTEMSKILLLKQKKESVPFKSGSSPFKKARNYYM